MILYKKETVKILQCYKLQFDKDLRPLRLKRYKVKTMLMLGMQHKVPGNPLSLVR